MKLHYSHDLQSPKESAFDTLMDPLNLKNFIPGCESFECINENSYEIYSRFNIGPIEVRHTVTMRLVDSKKPDSVRIVIFGEGTGSSINAEGILSLEAIADRTRIVINGKAQITGLLANLGSDVLEQSVKTLLKEYFNSLKFRATI